MGISNAEIGSLAYQEIMTYAKDEQLVNDSVNEKSTAEIIYNTAAQVQDCLDLPSAIYKTSTNNQFTLQEEFIEEFIQFPLYAVDTSVAASTPTTVGESSTIIKQHNNNNNNNNNKSDNNIMYPYGDFYRSSSNDNLFDNESDPQFINSLEAEKHEKPIDNEEIDNLACLNISNATEETFDFNHGNALPSTQEMIDLGISTQDFTLFKDTLYDQNNEVADSNEIIMVDNSTQFENELKSEKDPMLSVDILHEQSNNYEIKTVKYEQICDNTIDEQSYRVIETNSQKSENNRNKRRSVEAKTKRNLPKLKIKDEYNDIGSEQVNTGDILEDVLFWESQELKNKKIKLTSATTTTTTLPLDFYSNATNFDESTQFSTISSVPGSSNFSDAPWTAPSTPSTSFDYNNSSGPSTPAKKSRGRPPKIHSTVPDPDELSRMPETKQKYVLGRYKNNEASRQSRLNRKNKQENKKREETILEALNNKLKNELMKWQTKESTLKQMLSEQIKSTL